MAKYCILVKPEIDWLVGMEKSLIIRLGNYCESWPLCVCVCESFIDV